MAATAPLHRFLLICAATAFNRPHDHWSHRLLHLRAALSPTEAHENIRTIYDAVVERVLEKMSAVVVGKPLDAATTMGPLVSREQQERVRVGAGNALNVERRVET